MIAGIIAQEKVPLPRGTIAPVFSVVDADNIFFAIVTSGLTQRLLPTGASVTFDADDFFVPDMPLVLVSDAVIYSWDGGDMERVYPASVTHDLAMAAGFHIDGDSFSRPDIRVPGYLLPPMVLASDIIFPTPLILDPGMWRQTITHHDNDYFFDPIVYAADTLFAPLLDSADQFHAPSVRAGGIGPPFFLSDDLVFSLNSTSGYRPSLFVDDAIPPHAATIFDTLLTNVAVTPDGVTAQVILPNRNSSGVTASLFKERGKFYFEVTQGPSHGGRDCIGLLLEGGTYLAMAQGGASSHIAFYPNYFVGFAPEFGGTAAGTIIYGNRGYTRVGQPAEGDVMGFAIDFDNRKLWVRRNEGTWNDDYLMSTYWPNQDPETNGGGVPLPAGTRWRVACSFGSISGSFSNSQSNDSFTVNFGLKAYRNPAPEGFIDWEIETGLKLGSTADRFGPSVAALPLNFDGMTADVALTNGKLTVTHLTTNSNSAATTETWENSGKLYFEAVFNNTHGANDFMGIMRKSNRFNEIASSGSECCAVYASDGRICSQGGDTGKKIGKINIGDVVDFAVDLTEQTKTFGGLGWFRRQNGPWNGDVLADPTLKAGGVPLQGTMYAIEWSPAVGFGAGGTAIGDQITANFGQSVYNYPAPNGFACWSSVPTGAVKILVPTLLDDVDDFKVPFADLFIKYVYHPDQPVFDAAETIFPTRTIGGTLMFYPGELVIDNDVIPLAGYYAQFDKATTGVVLSNNNHTATISVVSPNTNTWYSARSAAYKTVGKHYFEVRCDLTRNTQHGIGIFTENVTDVAGAFNGQNCAMYYVHGPVVTNNTTQIYMPLMVNGDLIGIAVDLDIRRIWFRLNLGNWNNNAGADPNTGVGGLMIHALVPFAPVVTFQGSPNPLIPDAYTANFGRTAFVNPVPPIFAKGWSGTSNSQRAAAGLLVPNDDDIHVPRVSPANLFAEFLPDDGSIFLMSGSGGSPTLGPQTSIDDADAIYAPAIALILTQFDSTTRANVTLSNANLTVTHANTNNNAAVRSNSFKTAGKWYFEVTMTNVHGASDCAGLISQLGGYDNLVTNGTNCLATYRNTGNIYGNNAYSGKTLGAIAIGDNIGIAVDLTTRRGWLRKNGGLWNGLAIGSENPATGAGGIVLNATVAFAPAIGFGGSGTVAADAQTANFGDTAFLFAPPPLFDKWTAGAASVLATIDGLISNTAVTNGGLTVTKSAAADGGARSLTTKSSGKYYFEVTIGLMRGGSDNVGVLSNPGSFAQQGSGQFCLVVFCNYNNGAIYHNNTSSGGINYDLVPGDVVQVAIDLDARMGFFRRVGQPLWNNWAAADPATSAQGAIMHSAASQALFAPSVTMMNTGTTVGDTVTFNFGQNAYVATPPPGYGNWMTGS